MGIIDEAGSIFNRGLASAGRGTRVLSVKAQISELDKKRNEQLLQLGALLFEETQSNADIRKPHEQLYASIEAIDQQKQPFLDELAELEEQARVIASQNSGGIACLCGCRNEAGVSFCVNCGQPIVAEQAQGDAAGIVCTACGQTSESGSAFCVACGAALSPKDKEEVAGPACAQCGAVNDKGDSFCKSCGTQLEN